MTLTEVAERYGTDKAELGYCPHYETHLQEPNLLLEVGIGSGASLRMWNEWFPDARIMGIDNDPECIYDDCECHRGDATQLESFGWLPGGLDVVIDDGSHKATDVCATFELLWPRLNVGGWYVIEDLACVRHPQFGGDPAGGPVMALIAKLALRAVQGRNEIHLYEQIAFVRKL